MVQTNQHLAIKHHLGVFIDTISLIGVYLTLGSITHMPTIPSNDNAGVIAPAPILYGIPFVVGFAAEKIAPTHQETVALHF
jgi:hypothetical protein